METAKLITSDTGQVLVLPAEFQFDGTEVYIKRVGHAIVLFDKDHPWRSQKQCHRISIWASGCVIRTGRGLTILISIYTFLLQMAHVYTNLCQPHPQLVSLFSHNLAQHRPRQV